MLKSTRRRFLSLSLLGIGTLCLRSRLFAETPASDPTRQEAGTYFLEHGILEGNTHCSVLIFAESDGERIIKFLPSMGYIATPVDKLSLLDPNVQVDAQSMARYGQVLGVNIPSEQAATIHVDLYFAPHQTNSSQTEAALEQTNSLPNALSLLLLRDKTTGQPLRKLLGTIQFDDSPLAFPFIMESTLPEDGITIEKLWQNTAALRPRDFSQKGGYKVNFSNLKGHQSFYEQCVRQVPATVTLYRVADEAMKNDRIIRRFSRKDPVAHIRLSSSDNYIRQTQPTISKATAVVVAGLHAGKGIRDMPGGMPFCFITTATCETVGLADNCWELRTLRRFRDTVLPALPEGGADISRYYREAPQLLAAIRKSADARLELLGIYWKYILPCALLARVGANRLCHRRYREMMYRLQVRHGKAIPS